MKPILKLILKLILIPTSALLIVFFLNKQSEKIIGQPYADTYKFMFIKDQVQISNVGSSHSEYAFNYENLESEGYQCFNFALSSQTYDYDYALLNAYADHLAKGGIVFIPVSYFSFNNEVTNDDERESQSIRYYQFLSPSSIPDYNFYVDICTTRLPILSAGEDTLKLVKLPDFSKLKEAFSSSVVTSVYTEATTVASTETSTTASAESSTAADTAVSANDVSTAATTVGSTPAPAVNTVELQEKAVQRYERHFANKDSYFLEERKTELRQIIAFCQEHELTPILITTPYTPYYTDLVSEDFYKEFYQTIQTISEDTGAPYYDYSKDPRFQQNLSYFADPDHLNAVGSAYFTSLIEEDIPEFKEFLTKTKK